MIRAEETENAVEVSVRGDTPTIALELTELMRCIRKTFEHTMGAEGARIMLVEIGNMACMDKDANIDFIVSGAAQKHVDSLMESMKGEEE